MDYFKYCIIAEPEIAEYLPAFLGEQPFDTFEETPDGFNAYVPAHAEDAAIGQYLDSLRDEHDFMWEKSFVPHQNWNEVWESNFQPIVIGDFCAVRADFHEPYGDRVRHELVIVPKMAFGTGHHETTYMCLAAMEHIPLQGQKILDYGCGTGILAILAARLGAAALEAVDIEEESYHSTIENCTDNGVTNVTARFGTIEAVEGNGFDGILANISRNIILQSLPRLAELAAPKAWILASGFLTHDEGILTEAFASLGFKKQQVSQRGNWLCIRFERDLG